MTPTEHRRKSRQHGGHARLLLMIVIACIVGIGWMNIWLVFRSLDDNQVVLQQQRQQQQPQDGQGFHDFQEFDILIVGAGLSGTVLADLYARKHGKKVMVLERRPHIGGNCYDFREKETDILINQYGAHLFHTNKERVWQYVHRFSEWTPYEHRVIGRVDGKLVPIPVNIDTVNGLMNTKIRSLKEMQAWLAKERADAKNSGIPIEEWENPTNSRTVGMSRVGLRLYNSLFREYTYKQWNVYPEKLSSLVLSRIPVREDWDDRYFPNDKYQALPMYGYTQWFQEALSHPNIKVYTSINYFDVMKNVDGFKDKRFEKTFFTGQIDQYFRSKGVDLKPLQYRSIRFEPIIVRDDRSTVSQSSFVVNFPQFKYGEHTRTAEYKHMYHQSYRSRSSILIREYSTDITDETVEPYYPFPTEENQAHFEQYRELAVREEVEHDVHFVGRLANYKYFNMDDAIENALSLYDRIEKHGSLLDQALAEGQHLINLKQERENRFHVHFVLALRYDGNWETLKTLITEQLCGQYGKGRNVKIFIYNDGKKIQQDGIIMKCNDNHEVDLLQGKSLFVTNLQQQVEVERLWIQYFMENGFSFGDANVFLNARDGNLDRFTSVGDGLNKIFQHLYLQNMTKASQPSIFTNDIRTVLVQALSENKETNLMHIQPVLIGQKKNNNMKENPICKVSMDPSHGFIATDASIRRMLGVFRTKLHDEFFATNSHNHDMDWLNSFWFCLFIDLQDKMHES